jgi:hypothetical protein
MPRSVTQAIALRVVFSKESVMHTLNARFSFPFVLNSGTLWLMKIRAIAVAWALSLAGLLSPTLSFADSKPDNKAAEKHDKGEKHEGNEKRSLPGAPASGSASGSASAAPSASSTGGRKRRELTDEEKQQRKEHMTELRAKWGETLKKPGVKDEMHTHLSTLAKLRRIAKLAKEDKKEGVQKRAEAAIKREKERHDKKMDELKGSVAPSGSVTATASATASATATAKPTATATATAATTGAAK